MAFVGTNASTSYQQHSIYALWWNGFTGGIGQCKDGLRIYAEIC